MKHTTFRNAEKRKILTSQSKWTRRIRFRGNARNFDLNRDFIKNDTENAKAFQEIFHWLKPIYFIDNHVSNGADYQYTFTYISTNKERLGNSLGTYFHQEMQPKLIQNMEKSKILNVPYVNIHGDSPDEGFPAFMDSPRYATGLHYPFQYSGNGGRNAHAKTLQRPRKSNV